MKILELTNYSAGICGVWARAREESIRLSKNNEVVVFSSNRIKGSEGIAESEEILGNVKIKRFKASKIGGESFMKWDFEKEALEYSPDVIIAHSYRHPHTTKALKIKDKINCKVILVTHAPFSKSNETRGFISKMAVNFYDKFIGPKTINKFDKIFSITRWENPYLAEIGADFDKVEYIPNGIPEEFFVSKKWKEENKILFLGRIAPVKDLETLIRAMSLIRSQDIMLEMVGPSEEDYMRKLNELIDELGLKNKIIFTEQIREIKDKIKKIDSAKIFVLPSKRESMPQSLIEAMARGKAVIGSANDGAKEIIQDGKNGLLFEIGNEVELAEKIRFLINNDKKIKEIGKNAKEYVRKFGWDKIITKIEEAIS